MERRGGARREGDLDLRPFLSPLLTCSPSPETDSKRFEFHQTLSLEQRGGSRPTNERRAHTYGGPVYPFAPTYIAGRRRSTRVSCHALIGLMPIGQAPSAVATDHPLASRWLRVASRPPSLPVVRRRSFRNR